MFSSRAREMRKTVVFQMKVPAIVRHEEGTFYSSCPALDVHSQGDTEKQALDNLIEALQLFVETCYEQGTLEQVLQAQGFEPGHGEEGEGIDGCTVEVPLSLIARQHAEARAH